MIVVNNSADATSFELTHAEALNFHIPLFTVKNLISIIN